jgi:uncharacterized protein YgbK (DUF1537 family)
MKPLISYYGDDFTGSTDVMEALASHGVKTVLFTRLPTQDEFHPFTEHQAIGLAGSSRSQTPEWMERHLPPAFEWLRALDARFCHYKVCSTFDSSPAVGSIGRAIEIAQRVFNQVTVPLIVGAPQLKRYTFAGNLFAAFQGELYRIDRHPVMSRHPVTPMDEADLRIHLGRQTRQTVRLAKPGMTEPGIYMFDVVDQQTQVKAGEFLLSLPENALPFLAGSSGVEYALVKALEAQGQLPEQTAFADLPGVERMLTVSGSVSPTTERQIRYALANGFDGIAADTLQLGSENNEAEIARLIEAASALLDQGKSPIIYTALGSATDKGAALDASARQRLGRALGQIARNCVERFRLSRLVIAGGDSSSHALGELDI